MRKRSLLLALMVGAIVAIPAQAAQAAFGVAQWTAGVYTDDYSGPKDPNYFTQSGGHPFTAVTDFTMNTTGNGAPDGTVSKVRVDVPPGLISNPQGVPQCPQATFPNCPANTQVGIVKVVASVPPGFAYVVASVYNLVPPAGQVSDFAFNALGMPVHILGGIRGTTDDGLFFTIDAPTSAPLVSSALIFWGIPSDPGHDPQRGFSCVALGVNTCSVPASGPSDPSKATGQAFVTLPTGCLPPGQITTLTVGSTTGEQATAQSVTPVAATDCTALKFSPGLSIALPDKTQTTRGKHPSLVATVTQTTGEANIQTAKVTLPLSLALDPVNSTHLCSVADSQADTCPSSSIIGTATITTPLLSQPLSGNVYLVQGIRTDSSGHEIKTLPALLVALRGVVAIDLRGQTSVDSKSRLVTTFPTVPDAPVSRFTLSIGGGPRGILEVTGNSKDGVCHGRQVGSAVFTGHNNAQTNQSVTISTPCGKLAAVKQVKVKGHTVQVVVAVGGAGKLSVGGPGLDTVRRRATHAGKVSFTLHLSKSGTARLNKTGKLKVRATIHYAQKGFPTQTAASKRVTIRR